MPTNTTDRQYINLLVFAVVAGVVSVIIMVVTVTAGATDGVRRLTPAIVTIEVGLLLIIANAIYQAVKYLNKKKDTTLDAKLHVSTCPDYWTLETQDEDGNRVCTNTFKDPLNPKIVYTITGTHADAAEVRHVRLAEYNDKTVREACAKSAAEVRAPWTTIDAMCASYNLPQNGL